MAPASKLALKFKPESFSVTERNGSEVLVKSDTDGRCYRRNVSHVKLLPTETADDQLVVSADVSATNKSNDPLPDVNNEEQPSVDKAIRPKRNVSKPTRYQ